MPLGGPTDSRVPSPGWNRQEQNPASRPLETARRRFSRNSSWPRLPVACGRRPPLGTGRRKLFHRPGQGPTGREPNGLRPDGSLRGGRPPHHQQDLAPRGSGGAPGHPHRGREPWAGSAARNPERARGRGGVRDFRLDRDPARERLSRGAGDDARGAEPKASVRVAARCVRAQSGRVRLGGRTSVSTARPRG